MPVRIYEIAKKLNLESKFVLMKAREMGIFAAKVPSSTLDKITAEFLEEQLTPLAKPFEASQPIEFAPVAIIHAAAPVIAPSLPVSVLGAPVPQSPVIDPSHRSNPELKPVSARTESVVPTEPVLGGRVPLLQKSASKPVDSLPMDSVSKSTRTPPASVLGGASNLQPAPAPAPAPAPVKQTGQLVGRIDLSQFGYGGRTTRGVSANAPAPQPVAPPPPPPPAQRPADSRNRLGPGQFQRGGQGSYGRSAGAVGPRFAGNAGSRQAPSQQAPARPVAPPRQQYAVDAPTIIMRPPILVRELAEKMGKKPFQVIGDLMQMGVFATVTQTIEPEAAIKICAKHGIRFETEKRDKASHVVNIPKEDKIQLDSEDQTETLKSRPPIITIMGHVDHGKTSLLDVIRKANVAAGEAGGITQHIGAYSIAYPHPTTGNLESLTFLDTPGHAAFAAMRARGANVTDIVVLVVASNDGVMPQTLEALAHAKAAKVPIIVAVNKCDHPASNPIKVRQQLQDKGLVPDDWGGDTLFVECSAITKKGIDTLIVSILLQAELLELKANPDRNAKGNVIESGVEAGGSVATVLIRKGTLRVGDVIICGEHYGKVRAMMNEEGQRLKEASPSVAVRVLGLNGVPDAGSEFSAVENERAARDLAEERCEKRRKLEFDGDRRTRTRASLSDLFGRIGDLTAKVLKVIVKADTQGSMEALVGALREIKATKVSLEVVHSAVGAVNVSDINLARGTKAVVLGFHARIDNNAAEEAKRYGVEIRLYAIIYELVDQVREAMAGLLDPLLKDTIVGQAEIRKVFDLSKGGRVAGCAVTNGRLLRGKMRLRRRGNLVYEGVSLTLKRFQDEVNEVRLGMECGVRLEGFDDYEEGDIIECYSVEKIAAKLE
ncbi:MAG: translation initiation factor IF-2 [Pedosphaera sp.]|nr:translation initiation factor IF-2 [Pedosphaera sp.]